MAIKTRLILAMAALLGVATVIIGTVATAAVTGTMTDRLDAQLHEYVTEAEHLVDNEGFGPTSRASAKPLAYQQMALLVVRSDGVVLDATAAGFSDELLPLPRIPRPLPEPGNPVTVGSSGSALQYRMLVGSHAPQRTILTNSDALEVRVVVAAPLDEVARVRTDMNYTMIVTVALVLAAGIVAAWWITRQGLRPITKMIDAAAAVADGDLDRRLPTRGRRTEIGKLATALNIMVSKLVSAITQRDNQQARLRRFIADASHELRTPLAAISGYAELYESGAAQPGPALDRAIARIRSESTRMAALVDDLLLLARLDQDSPGAARTRVDLAQLARDAVDDARAVGSGHVFELRTDDPVSVRADEARIRQVITNLLSNARTHTPPNTLVTVTVHKHRNTAVLTVADDGPGIPLVHRQRVFDRFYRADDSRSRETGGSGLGLSIVKSIIEAHDGDVALESQLGKGTAIRITLPAGVEEPHTSG